MNSFSECIKIVNFLAVKDSPTMSLNFTQIGE